QGSGSRVVRVRAGVGRCLTAGYGGNRAGRADRTRRGGTEAVASTPGREPDAGCLGDSRELPGSCRTRARRGSAVRRYRRREFLQDRDGAEHVAVGAAATHPRRDVRGGMTVTDILPANEMGRDLPRRDGVTKVTW